MLTEGVTCESLRILARWHSQWYRRTHMAVSGARADAYFTEFGERLLEPVGDNVRYHHKKRCDAVRAQLRKTCGSDDIHTPKAWRKS